MPAYAGPSAHRPGDVAGTLRLLAYLALAVTLIVLDHRGGWLAQARRQADLLAQPLRALAGLPGRALEWLGEAAATRDRLLEENRALRRELLVHQARMARLQTAYADNVRLRALLGMVQRGGLDVQLAPILDVDLDPARQRLLLDAGSRAGVRVGQAVIDAGGVVGQVVEVTPLHATVLLITDPDHAIPVAVLRNGVRLVAYGTGHNDRLVLASIPLSSDVKVGDVLVTSGLGERFPAGFPVGTITGLHPDDSRAFLVGEVRPAARLDRGREVLLLRRAPQRPLVALPPAEPAPTLPATPAASAPVDGDAPAAPPAAARSASPAAPGPEPAP
ncbi:rod shape-determining protein MreC [Vulcaniibacterium gelatinicum]|uniref:rod shape-determining protein MreC n=1 Tax=Vulcaniibacterium gelatinicum TaxID=2598725 RepID=UPI0011CBAFF8